MCLRPASLCLALFLAALVGNVSAAETVTLRYAQGAYAAGVGRLPFVIGERKGFFAREGVRLEFVTSAGNAIAAEQGYNPALERGGTAGMAQVPTGSLIQSVLNGSNTVAILAQLNNPVYSLIVRPEIKSYADLKGKEVTLTSPWDTITVTTRKQLALHGIGGLDFVYKPIPGSEARLACMKAGECAAVVLTQPTDIDALNSGNGYHRLGYASEAGPIIFNIEIVNRDWAAQNKDTILRYLRGSAASMRYINNPTNRAEIVGIIGELAMASPAVANEIAGHMFDPKLRVLTRNAELDVTALQHLLDLFKETGVYDKPMPAAARFVDLSYAQAAGIR